MSTEKILTLKKTAKILGISNRNVLDKARRLKILKWSETWEKYYLLEEDLKYFKVDYRRKENRPPKKDSDKK